MACKERRYGAFVISGKIDNAPSDKVYLEHLPFGGKEPVVVDSTTIKKDGQFELRSIANEEGIYGLAIDKGPEVLLINDNNGIRVKLDMNNFKSYTTDGSDASTKLHQFLDVYSKEYPKLTSLIKLDDSLRSTKITDSVATVLSSQEDAQLKKVNTVIHDAITNTSSPALRYYLIGKAYATMQPEEIKKLADASANDFKEHSGLAYLKTIANAAVPNYELSGKQAPEISLTDTAGKAITLSSFRGKYVLVDFWASWCAPCRAENPNVVATYKKYKDKNFTILGVSLDKSKGAWKDAIETDKLSWTQVSDLKEWDSDVVKPYHINGIPFNVLLDPERKIIAFGLTGKKLERKLEEVLK